MNRLRCTIAALGVLSSGCINFQYARDRTGAPVDPAAVETIAPGSASLGECLRALGAPDWVWPSDEGQINLAYAWTDSHDWGVSVSWSLERFVSIKTSFDSVDFESKSVVLAFDPNLQLTHVSQGFLYDIAPSAQASTAAGRLIRNTPR